MKYLYLGDCLEVLRNYIQDESVDLIYIDPPFNSKRNYNIFFDDKDIQSQRIAFEDTWTLKSISDSMIELSSFETEKLSTLLNAYQEVAPFAFPYLVMMALRIRELHRVLKSTGSFYLHCDPTMSHYLKTICDVIFDVDNFRNEITWKRTSSIKTSQFKNKKYPNNSDILFFYTKSQNYNFDSEVIKIAFTDSDIEKRYSFIDEKGRYAKSPIFRSISMGERPNLCYEYKGVSNPNSAGWKVSINKLREIDKAGDLGWSKNGIPFRKFRPEHTKGFLVSNIWDDIEQTSGKERLGYPTQKPLALLERIIKAGSNEGDIVLDAFCGCGTSLDAAERLKRNWIGIDISPIAISLIDKRLKNTYHSKVIDKKPKYEIRGVPTDKQSAVKLWEQNPFAFQDWWIMEFEAFSSTFGGKGADKGLDGIAKYLTPMPEDTKKVIKAGFQVKGGKVGSKDIDALIGAMSKHNCELGIFLSINSLTKPMLDTISKAGYLTIGSKKYPKLQYITIEQFFNKQRQINLPSNNITFAKAQLKKQNLKQQNIF